MQITNIIQLLSNQVILYLVLKIRFFILVIRSSLVVVLVHIVNFLTVIAEILL